MVGPVPRKAALGARAPAPLRTVLRGWPSVPMSESHNARHALAQCAEQIGTSGGVHVSQNARPRIPRHSITYRRVGDASRCAVRRSSGCGHQPRICAACSAC